MLLNNEQQSREQDISNIQHFMEIWSLVVTNITDHLETSNIIRLYYCIGCSVGSSGGKQTIV